MITDDNKNYNPGDRNLMQDLQNQLQPENYNNGDDPTVESISYQNTNFSSDDASDREPLSENNLNEDTQEEDEANNPEENFDENYSESENFATD